MYLGVTLRSRRRWRLHEGKSVGPAAGAGGGRGFQRDSHKNGIQSGRVKETHDQVTLDLKMRTIYFRNNLLNYL